MTNPEFHTDIIKAPKHKEAKEKSLAKKMSKSIIIPKHESDRYVKFDKITEKWISGYAVVPVIQESPSLLSLHELIEKHIGIFEDWVSDDPDIDNRKYVIENIYTKIFDMDIKKSRNRTKIDKKIINDFNKIYKLTQSILKNSLESQSLKLFRIFHGDKGWELVKTVKSLNEGDTVKIKHENNIASFCDTPTPNINFDDYHEFTVKTNMPIENILFHYMLLPDSGEITKQEREILVINKLPYKMILYSKELREDEED